MVARDTENRKKTKIGKSASANALNSFVEERKEADDPVLKELQKLTAQVSQLSTKQTNMERKLEDVSHRQAAGFDHQQQDDDNHNNNDRSRDRFNVNRGGYGGGRGRGGYGYRRFLKCDACQKSNAYCKHCSTCGSADHKRADCTEN